MIFLRCMASKPIRSKKKCVVESLQPNRRIQNLELVLLRIYPSRMVLSERYTGPVAAACGRDHTGLVGIVLWNEQIEQFRVGDVIRIEAGWCKIRNGQLVVSTGRRGRISLVDR